MIDFYVLPACTVDPGSAVCWMEPWPRLPPLNEVTYGDVLTSADFIEALTFMVLTGILAYCLVRALVRGWMLRRAHRQSIELMAGIADALYLNDRARAFTLLASASETALARVVCAGLKAARAKERRESCDGGVSWAWNLAAHVETRKLGRGVWELYVAACIAPVIAALFSWYIIDLIESGAIPGVAGPPQGLKALAFSACIVAVALSLNAWLSSEATDLCLSIDRFSRVLVERLLGPGNESRTDWLPPASHPGTIPLAGRRTLPLVNRSPFILLQLRD